MGGTLPTLLAGFAQREALARRLPVLYATNTLGGAVGALAAGYWAVEALGLDGTLLACASLNGAIGLGCLALAARPSPLPDVAPVGDGPDRAAGSAKPPGSSAPALVLLAFGQGVLAFVLEVTWTHLIRTTIGVTTYAFTSMLGAILLGLGLGSLAVAPLLRRSRPILVFAGAQLLLAATLVVSLYLWDRFPLVVAWTLRIQYQWSFAEREMVRFAWCLALLLPPSCALGISLPALTAAVRMERPEARGAAAPWVGLMLGANTLGAIVGALVGGFVLLGSVPSSGILSGAAIAAIALSTPPLVAVSRHRRRFARFGPWLVPLACVVGLAAFPGGTSPGSPPGTTTCGTSSRETIALLSSFRRTPPPGSSR